MNSRTLLTLFLGLCPLAPLDAEEEVLPTGFPVTRYTAIWENSPFNREVVKVAAKTLESSFAQSLVLEGLVSDEVKGPVAYVRDIREDSPLVITTAKSESHPYTVVSANQSNRPEETKVTVTDGKETGEIGYIVAKLTQPIAQVAPAPPQNQNRPGQGVPGRDMRGGGGVTSSTPPSGGGQAGASRPPGNTNPNIKPEDANKPQSVAPALDNMDAEPKRRRVPLPGN